MDKIKVLHIITRLDPGGSSTNTIETAARLDRGRFDVFLISGRTVDPDGSIEALLKAKKIRYAFFPDLQRALHPWKDLLAFVQIYNFLKNNRFDIIHTHSSKAGILGRWAGKFAGVPVIVHTPHGHVFYGYFGKIQTAIFILLERCTALVTGRIITLTDRGKQEHIDLKIAPADKFVTIYSGIDLAMAGPPTHTFGGDSYEKFSIPKDRFIFGCVARLDPIKGISYLIEAMAEVVKQRPSSHLLLVGDGSERETLQHRCEALGLKDHVSFAGFQKEPGPFMDVMDVFVLASINEGMGRVILEAMARGKPVIATRVGGVPEIVEEGQTGLLVPAADAAALADAMLKMAGDRGSLEHMGRRARASVNSRFGLDKMVKDIERLYDQLVP